MVDSFSVGLVAALDKQASTAEKIEWKPVGCEAEQASNIKNQQTVPALTENGWIRPG